MELSDYRSEIDRIDRELVRLFAERMRTAAGIDRRTFENRYRQRFDPMEKLFVQYGEAGLAA